MKCAVAIVLALVAVATANPVPPLAYKIVSPVLLPSAVSVSSSIVNHGLTIPKVVVPAPIITSYVAPTVIKAPIGLGWGGLGWGGLGWNSLGWNSLAWGKAWH